MNSILRNTKVSINTLKNADNETLTGATLDMQGYDSVAFIAFGLKGNVATPTIKAQEGAASDMSDAADLLGTSVNFATTVSADGLTVLEIHNPRKRYVRAIVAVPDITATPHGVIALQFNAKDLPITNAGELHSSPAEGTA